TYSGNGTTLDTVGRDNAGRLSGLTWKAAGGTALAADTVTRSQAGRVTDETIDGVDANPGGANFTYDTAGRLVAASVAGHSLTYGFGTSTGCTLAPNAGVNANRSSVIDNSATTTYCYDAADRLVSSSDPAVGTPAYDARGNTTTLGAQSLSFDGADRHTKTVVASGPTVSYLRDATDRIIARTEGTTTTRYGFAGPGDGPAFTMDTSNAVQERMVGLVGGAMVTKRAGGDVWSYPNIHGDVIATANAAGAKQGATLSYDPFGQATAVPDNSAGNMDYGWLGGALRPSEHAAGISTIEMGARPYVPGLGRFLSVDPVAGGSCNGYDYVCGDAVNGRDLTGLRGTKPLPDLDRECLGGNYDQLRSDKCRGYQQAKVTGDSDFYYKGKTFSEPGKPNAFLMTVGNAASPTLVHGKYLPSVSGAYGCIKSGREFAVAGFFVGGSVGSAFPVIGTAEGAAAGFATGAVVGCAVGYNTPPTP
ncbi:MAG: hypothetical protein M3021_01235, partial [Actinomycetota bacterium]|nr:hypothetical protein [Actinomycetota bacterium]